MAKNLIFFECVHQKHRCSETTLKVFDVIQSEKEESYMVLSINKVVISIDINNTLYRWHIVSKISGCLKSTQNTTIEHRKIE